MGTLISDPLRYAADQLVHHSGYASAVLSGLAPDNQHLDRGGFHCSVLDLRAHGNEDDYSNTRTNDRDLNVQYGAAFDVSLAKADMIRAFGRVHTVWADLADPRRRFVNAVNCWDGSGDATRLDFDAGRAERASSDHVWHVHGEIHRRFVLDPKAARAVVSIFQGEPKALWVAREEPKVVVKMLPISGQIPQLTKGMHDPINGWGMVARLQKLLGVKADGDYGKLTAEAVRAYDHTNLNRTTDGNTVDTAFWKRIYGITGN
jgi:hypothetical protein